MNYITSVISNISNGYIHLYWIGPPTFALYGKYMGRCSMESKMMEEYHLKFAYCLDDIHFKSLNVIYMQLVGAYISKEMTNLLECIPYTFWQQITIS
jgi:hypothetical protein